LSFFGQKESGRKAALKMLVILTTELRHIRVDRGKICSKPRLPGRFRLSRRPQLHSLLHAHLQQSHQSLDFMHTCPKSYFALKMMKLVFCLLLNDLAFWNCVLNLLPLTQGQKQDRDV
jgi:hypothetical protein